MISALPHDFGQGGQNGMQWNIGVAKWCDPPQSKHRLGKLGDPRMYIPLIRGT